MEFTLAFGPKPEFSFSFKYYLDCKIAPKEKGTYVLEVTYAVADSIRKARIEVEVV